MQRNGDSMFLGCRCGSNEWAVVCVASQAFPVISSLICVECGTDTSVAWGKVECPKPVKARISQEGLAHSVNVGYYPVVASLTLGQRRPAVNDDLNIEGDNLLLNQLVKPRSPKEFFEEQKKQNVEVEKARQGRLIEFVESRMMEQTYDRYRRLGFRIPSDEFPEEFGSDHYRRLDYLNAVYSDSGWLIDDGSDEEGKSVIGFIDASRR